MPTRHLPPRRTLVFAALAAALCSIGRDAADASPPDADDAAQRIRTGRLRFAQTSRPIAPVAAAPGARAADVAGKLRRGLAALRGAPAAAKTAPAPPPPRGPALAQRVTDATGQTFDVHRAPGEATPRQIRGVSVRRSAAAGAPGLEAGVAAARRFLDEQRALLGLRDPSSELRLVASQIDDLGCRQLRFAQTWRGLDVWPAALVVQVRDDGTVDLVSGAFVPTPRRVSTRPAIRARTAERLAREAVPGAAAADVGKPELVVRAGARARTRLAWKVEVAVSDAERWLVLVDAQTGAVLESFDEVAHEDVAGSGTDLLGATRPLRVWHEGANYFMVDTSKPMFDGTSDPPNPLSTRGGIVVVDARHTGPEQGLSTFNVSSANPAAWALADAVSASFGLSQTYDYYLARHNRNSLDGEGGTMMAIVRVGNGFENAFWNGRYMAFGDALPFAASLDVVGHELTHGVTEKTAGLLYRDQSGALNEAFSDIFGEMVEARATGGGHDWKVGSALPSAFRDMRNPSSIDIQPGLPYPSRMTQFVQTSQDNGGVHLNSSIINRAYYLVAEGLPNAVGIADAERIFYRTLTSKLVKQSRFVDCRLGAIASADELFGAGSNQSRAVADAFDAVEILDTAPTPQPLPAPAVDGADATLFVYFDTGAGLPFLGRREPGLGDGASGVTFTSAAVGASRPSITGDGSLAAFVNFDDDICLADTRGDTAAACLGAAGSVHSVAMSPGGARFAFVLQDQFGQPLNSITVVDTATDEEATFPLAAPILDGGTIEVVEADTMTFTRDGRVLVYDALNVVSFADGSQLGLWSIYGLDLATGSVFTLVEPTPGLDIGNPSFAHTTDRFLAFEAYDSAASQTTVLTIDTFSGELGAIAAVADPVELASPSFTGDDAAIVYTVPSATNTGSSLVRQGLAASRLEPAGQLTAWLDDAAYGVVYRRGAMTPLPPPPDVELTVATGVPKIETLDFDLSVEGSAVPVRLALAHSAAGGFVAGGPCTVAGADVVVSGKLGFRPSTGSFTYSLTLRSSATSVVVKVKGDLAAGTASVSYSGPEGRGKAAGLAMRVVSFEPTARIVLRPEVDFLGRISGTGTIVGGFGNDTGGVGVLSGKLKPASLKLTLKDASARRSVSFKGARTASGFVGRLTAVIPPAGATDANYTVPDVFGF